MDVVIYFDILFNRAINCDTKNQDCSVSITPNAEQQQLHQKSKQNKSQNDHHKIDSTKSLDWWHFHRDCVEPTRAAISTAGTNLCTNAEKKLRFKINKPLLKSIVSNKNNQSSLVHIKQEPVDDYPDPLKSIVNELPIDMQSMDHKKSKQIKPYFKTNGLAGDDPNGRSYSPPLPIKLNRSISTVAANHSNSNQMAGTNELKSMTHSNRSRKSGKKKKHRRRSYSRGSRSPTRSPSDSRSRSRSHYRKRSRRISSSRSRTHSRSSR